MSGNPFLHKPVCGKFVRWVDPDDALTLEFIRIDIVESTKLIQGNLGCAAVIRSHSRRRTTAGKKLWYIVKTQYRVLALKYYKVGIECSLALGSLDHCALNC